MSQKVLFVDDDQKILNAISRQFDDELEFETALGPAEALEMIDDEGPFAVVVSDMRMPGMTGIELLKRVREISPDTVRMMLTGYADLKATIDAVNEGNVYRFLSKPCDQDVLEQAVQDGLNQYRLITAEHELLEGTLQGSINVLSEILALTNPLAFGRTCGVQRIAIAIGENLGLTNMWDLKIATKLFPLGCVTVSEQTLESVMLGQQLSDSDQAAFARHATVARKMLEQIPRLDSVAEIIGYQDYRYDGSGEPADGVSGDAIPQASRILKVAADFEAALRQTATATDAFGKLSSLSDHYDPAVLESLHAALRNGLCDASQRNITIAALTVGSVLASDLRSLSGQLMVAQGQEITQTVKTKLLTLLGNGVIEDDCVVEILGTVAVGVSG